MSRNTDRKRVATWSSRRRPNGQRAGGVHVDRVDVGDEDLDGAAQRDVESLRIPGIVGHVQLLEQHLLDARESGEHRGLVAMHRDRRIVVIERAFEPERGDRRPEAPAEMRQPFDEMRRQPEIVGAQLPVVLALAQRGVGEGLPVGVDQLVLLELVVELDRLDEVERVLDPERLVGDRLDFVRGLEHPALAPGVDDAVIVRRVGDEGERNLEDDRVDVLAGLRVLAGVDEAVIAVVVLLELVAGPGPRAGRQVELHAVAVIGDRRVVVEQVVALELEERLRDRQLARLRHGVRHVIELRRVVDRAEEARQVVEERVVAAADIDLDAMPAGRLQRRGHIRVDQPREVAARKADELHHRAVARVDRHPHLGGLEDAEIFLLHAVEVAQHAGEAVVVLVAGDTPVRPDADAVEQVAVERAGLRDGSEGQRDDDFLAAVAVGAWKSEDVVEIGGADVDVGKDRIDRIGIVVVSHRVSPSDGCQHPTTATGQHPSECAWMQGNLDCKEKARRQRERGQRNSRSPANDTARAHAWSVTRAPSTEFARTRSVALNRHSRARPGYPAQGGTAVPRYRDRRVEPGDDGKWLDPMP